MPANTVRAARENFNTANLARHNREVALRDQATITDGTGTTYRLARDARNELRIFTNDGAFIAGMTADTFRAVADTAIQFGLAYPIADGHTLDTVVLTAALTYINN